MGTDKHRIQGYFSDRTYAKIIEWQQEHAIKTISATLEHICAKFFFGDEEQLNTTPEARIEAIARAVTVNEVNPMIETLEALQMKIAAIEKSSMIDVGSNVTSLQDVKSSDAESDVTADIPSSNELQTEVTADPVKKTITQVAPKDKAATTNEVKTQPPESKTTSKKIEELEMKAIAHTQTEEFMPIKTTQPKVIATMVSYGFPPCSQKTISVWLHKGSKHKRQENQGYYFVSEYFAMQNGETWQIKPLPPLPEGR